MSGYYLDRVVTGRVILSDGRWYAAQLLTAPCGAARTCACGHCKAPEQCQWGDCANVRPEGSRGTLCADCTSKGYGRFPGHRDA